MSPIKHDAIYRCNLCSERCHPNNALTFQAKLENAEGANAGNWVLKTKQIVCGHNDTEDTIVVCFQCAKVVDKARSAAIRAVTSLDQ